MVFSPLETTRAVTSAVKRGNPRVEPRCTKTADSVFVQITQLGRHLTIVIHLSNYICKIRQVPVKQRVAELRKMVHDLPNPWRSGQRGTGWSYHHRETLTLHN